MEDFVLKKIDTEEDEDNPIKIKIEEGSKVEVPIINDDEINEIENNAEHQFEKMEIDEEINRSSEIQKMDIEI